MKSFRQTSRGITITTLLCFAATQAEAIEVYGARPIAVTARAVPANH
jgi:hypothetical protein